MHPIFAFVPSAMEDAHAIVLDLDEGKDGNTFFAVYDGHGGTSGSAIFSYHI